jgi:regulator of sirC expression with transglutaminase-like and TPR domain
MSAIDPTEQFAALVQSAGDAVPLDRAMLLIAAHAVPGLAIDEWLERIDNLAARCDAADGFAPLLTALFVDLGFAGDRDDYYNPRNSYLPDVIDRRRGIPITLSILAMEVGRRLRVPMNGVGMPGHFLVGDARDRDTFGDPFNAGAVLDRRGCEARFREIHGPDALFDSSFLDPVPSRAILIRVLANLKAAHRARNDRTGLIWVLRLRAGIPGVPIDERRELASVLAADGRFIDAAAALDELVDVAAAAGRDDLASEAARGATRLRARAN